MGKKFKKLIEKREETIPVKIVKSPVKKERKLPEVTFRVFKSVSGIKWDQLAGFESYVKRVKEIKRLTIPAWNALYEEYKVKPVK